MLSCSPLAKVPFIRTAQVRCARARPSSTTSRRCSPSRACCRPIPGRRPRAELTTFIDLHLELAARELYGKAFFGGEISEANAERVRKLLTKNIAAFKRLAKFSPYVAGDSFTQADCAAFVSLPLVGLASRIVLGEDLLAAAASTGRPT